MAILDLGLSVVAGTALVVAQVVVERHLSHTAGLQQRDDFIGPVGADPAAWSRPLVVKEDLHQTEPLRKTKFSHTSRGFKVPAVSLALKSESADSSGTASMRSRVKSLYWSPRSSTRRPAPFLTAM